MKNKIYNLLTKSKIIAIIIILVGLVSAIYSFLPHLEIKQENSLGSIATVN